MEDIQSESAGNFDWFTPDVAADVWNRLVASIDREIAQEVRALLLSRLNGNAWKIRDPERLLESRAPIRVKVAGEHLLIVAVQ